jgi:hypothetical protein
MGMIGCFAAVSQETLTGLRMNPDSIPEYLYPDDGESEPPNSLHIDKAWHGIHFLLTGEADGGSEPYCLAVLGGEEFGEDIGYGPARFLTPSQVAEVNDVLSNISDAELRQRYDPAKMKAKEIYPDVIWMRDGQEAFEYVKEYFQQLVSFYRKAAARGDAVVKWLT